MKGKYQYSEDLTRIRILSGDNIRVYHVEEIDSISSYKAYRAAAIERYASENPLFFRVETGFLFGSTANNQPAPLSFSGSVNYLMHSKFALGIGTGVEFLKESYLPAFVNAEYRLKPSGSTPLLFLHAGYLIPLEESRPFYYNNYPVHYDIWPWPYPSYNEELDPLGGILFNPGIGYTAIVASQFGLSVSFAYRFHRLNFSGEDDYELEIDYNRLNVKLGIIFY